MPTDRVIHFQTAPSFEDLVALAARYAGELADIHVADPPAGAEGSGRFFVRVRGFCDELRGPRDPHAEPRPRRIEVVVASRHLNVLTRDMDEATMFLADGLAHVLRAAWGGRTVLAGDLALLIRGLRECALCDAVATRTSRKTYRQGGVQFRCDTHSAPDAHWRDLPYAGFLRQFTT